MNSFIDKVEFYLINLLGYNDLMRLEDIIGIVCAFVLCHILTIHFSAFVSQKLVRDKKLSGFSVFKVESEVEGEPDKYRVNPKNTHDYVDIIYTTFCVWLCKKEDATFYNYKRIKAIQIIFVTLAIIVSVIGIALSIHVTNYIPQ